MEDTQTQRPLKDPRPGTGALTAEERGFRTQRWSPTLSGLGKKQGLSRWLQISNSLELLKAKFLRKKYNAILSLLINFN